MGEVLNYVSKEFYNSQKSGMNDGDIKLIFKEDNVEIELMMIGKKIYNVISKYGTKPIEDIAKSLMVQA